MKAFLIVASILLSSLSLRAQDIGYAKKIIEQLTSPYFFGRGYTKNGLGKAAGFISAEFAKMKIQPMQASSYFQSYTFSVNTFPGKMCVEVNGKKLRPGKDFIVSPESKSFKSKGTLILKDSTHFISSEQPVQISLAKKLTWSVAQKTAEYTSITVLNDALAKHPSTYKINIEGKLLKNFEAKNICGIIKGVRKPDSSILITAHYDHLGGMGSKTYFPGANDNASGVSLLLNLAKYYSEYPPDYSIGFVCFSGEEAGLLGSKYFSENPPISLKNTRFLINLDLTGTGEEGITVVNATEFKNEFAALNSLNSNQHYLPKINPRGKAANSDHYWFTQKGIPSFFIYTNGGIKAYHDIYDIAATLPLTEYEDLFKLIRDFNADLMK